MKRFFLLLILTLFFFIFSAQVEAAILFEDNFDDGNANGWTQLQPGWQVVNGKYGATVSGGLIHTVAGNITTPNYIIELDLLPVLGEDKNVTFRWSNNENKYEVHFNNNGAFMGGNGLIVDGVPFFLSNGTTYHVMLILNGQNIKFFVDGNKLFDVTDQNYQFSGHDQMGLRIGTGGALTTVWFDNIVVSSIDDSLDVHLLKQTDPAWGSQLYDSANLWSPLGKRGISDYGCAITSAVMVFNYHGITKLPSGQNLNPGSLNSWLISRPLGYLRNGVLNWAELATMSKLAKNNNPDFDHNSLEYKWYSGENKSLLTNDLSNGIPDILGEPNHFIVAKGKQGNTFTVNDPFYNRTDLSSYGETFSKMIRFIPSNSDLSYIILVAEGNTNITLKNSQGDVVGETFIQEPIIATSGGAQNGGALRFAQIAQPEDGNYNFTVSSNQITPYSLDLLVYDLSGVGKKVNFSGIVGPQNSDNFTVQFNKDNSANSSSSQKGVFDNLLKDLATLRSTNDIGLIEYKSLEAKAKTAGHLSTKKNTKKGAIDMLKDMDKQINSLKNKGMTQNAYNILHADIQAIIASL